MNAREFDIHQMVRPSIIELKPYASAKEEFKDFERQLIYLDANENPFDDGLNRYPDPHQKELKRRIGEIKGISASRILLGNGSDEILDMVYRVFFEPGVDNMIISVPTFGMFEVLAQVNNIECQKVLLTGSFQLQVSEIKKRMDEKTKAVFVCSPNNPTGNLMRREDILELLALPVLVVVDEAYVDFAPGSSLLSLLDEHANLIVTQTFSKAYGLAGIRLGMCFAGEEVIELLKKVKMPYNVNVLTQRTALVQLENTKGYAREVQAILEQRKYLRKALEQVSYVLKVFDSDSNFLLVLVDDADLRYRQLIQHGLVVRNRTREPLLENCLRITVGTETENRKLIKEMQGIENI